MRPTPFVYRAKLLRLIDGDTLVATIDMGFHTWRETTIRLVGINCPERKGETREEGEAATAFVAKLIQPGDPLLVQSQAADAFGRALALVWIGQAERSLNRMIVEAGHAVAWGHEALTESLDT